VAFWARICLHRQHSSQQVLRYSLIEGVNKGRPEAHRQFQKNTFEVLGAERSNITAHYGSTVVIKYAVQVEFYCVTVMII
jgi:hypothetical protein